MPIRGTTLPAIISLLIVTGSNINYISLMFRCRVCSGYKRMSCTACNAKGKVKCFVQLKVVW